MTIVTGDTSGTSQGIPPLSSAPPGLQDKPPLNPASLSPGSQSHDLLGDLSSSRPSDKLFAEKRPSQGNVSAVSGGNNLSGNNLSRGHSLMRLRQDRLSQRRLTGVSNAKSFLSTSRMSLSRPRFLSRNSHSEESDHDADGQELSLAEFNNLRRFFEVVDVNHSGTIDKQEVRRVMQALGMDVSEDDAQAMIEDTDGNGSGDLDFGEFITTVVNNREILNLARARMPRLSRKEIKYPDAPGTLMPDAGWRWAWDMIVMAAIFYHALQSVMWVMYVIRKDDVAPHWPAAAYFSIEVLTTLIFGINIFLMTRTAIVDPLSRLVTNRRAIQRAYFKGLLIFDFLGFLPMDTVSRLIISPSLVSWPSTAATLFRLFNFAHVTFLFGVSERNHVVTATYIHFMFYFVPILRLLFWSLIALHWFSVIALIMGIADDLEGNALYIDALYWVLYVISTCGYGDSPKEPHSTVAGSIYSIFLFTLSIIVNATIIAKMGEMLSNKTLEEDAQNKMRDTLTLLHHFDVPPDMCNAFLGFQSHVLRQNMSGSVANAIKHLPKMIQNRLALYVRIAVISEVPLFKAASEDCKICLAQSLQNRVVPPEEFLCVAGDPQREIMFLAHGFVEVLTDDAQHIAYLGPGDFFGIEAHHGIEQEARCNESIRALGYCDLFVLSIEELIDIAARFPRFASELKDDRIAIKVQDEKAGLRSIDIQADQPTSLDLMSERRSSKVSSIRDPLSTDTPTLEELGARHLTVNHRKFSGFSAGQAAQLSHPVLRSMMGFNEELDSTTLEHIRHEVNSMHGNMHALSQMILNSVPAVIQNVTRNDHGKTPQTPQGQLCAEIEEVRKDMAALGRRLEHRMSNIQSQMSNLANKLPLVTSSLCNLPIPESSNPARGKSKASKANARR